MLIDNNLHIWSFRIPVAEEKFKHFNALLSEDEFERAERFHFQKDRNEFVCSRGFLRETLSSYLSMVPSEIRFEYGKNGKPELADNAESKRIKFNLSHSKEYTLLAITKSDEVGIDIEFKKNIPDMFEIAKELYTENENYILKNSVNESMNIFFSYWTRKEAIIKAVGQGLSAPLRMIDVSSADNILVDKTFENESSEFEGCRIMELNAPAGYAAAAAYFGNVKQINYFTVE